MVFVEDKPIHNHINEKVSSREVSIDMVIPRNISKNNKNYVSSLVLPSYLQQGLVFTGYVRLRARMSCKDVFVPYRASSLKSIDRCNFFKPP